MNLAANQADKVMTRLLVHVEGQTEEEFVNEILAPHLYKSNFTDVSARLVGAARARKRRGGICNWPTARQEIANHLRSDINAFATTFVDYYALPSGGENGWPGRDNCEHLSTTQKAQHISKLIQEDFIESIGDNISRRFIPYVAMHEFEALLFSNPNKMAEGMAQDGLSGGFTNIRNMFDTPESINDSPQTAPSKRIIQLFPHYQKVLHGNLAALEVTLETMREECPVFSSWLDKLEAIP